MSQVAASFTSRLVDLIAADRVRTDSASLAAYEIDGRRPSAVLLSDSVSEIADILRFASAERLAVIATGGRTNLSIGMPPRQYDLALDLSPMNRILAYEPQDLTVGVEPGVRYAALDRSLHEKGQFLPLVPAHAERATLGGMVAAGADTPLRYGHGTARDYLLGIEFVTGEGVVSKSGGRVVKNVTGYDLHKLLIGSLGTLGVITRLNFRTFPLPPQQRMFVTSFADPSAAFVFCRAIMKSPLHPRLLEVIDPRTSSLFAASGADFLDRNSWLVVVEAAGQEAVLERHGRDLATMSREANAADIAALDEPHRTALFSCLCELSPIVLHAAPAATIFRIGGLPSEMPALLAQARQLAERHALDCAILIRALSVVYIALLPSEGSHALADLIACSSELMSLCISSGSLPMIEHCPLELKQTLSIWPPAGSEHDICARLKLVFDPQGVLSPGRFRGGI
jgi:glycolate oxidase FAD binding subunit